MPWRLSLTAVLQGAWVPSACIFDSSSCFRQAVPRKHRPGCSERPVNQSTNQRCCDFVSSVLRNSKLQRFTLHFYDLLFLSKGWFFTSLLRYIGSWSTPRFAYHAAVDTAGKQQRSSRENKKHGLFVLVSRSCTHRYKNSTDPLETRNMDTAPGYVVVYKKLKNVSCEYGRLNGWNSTSQAAWYIRHVRIIWFLWNKRTIRVIMQCSVLHKISFARVLCFIFVKDIGRWLPWTLPGSTERFSVTILCTDTI